MRILVLLAHPDPRSFNHAVAQRTIASLERLDHRVLFQDLYAEGFDPLLPREELLREAPLPPPIAAHCRELASAEGIVVIHPNWWGQPPAVLKGWIDRVLRPEVAYRFLEGDQGEGVPQGLLKARAAVVFNTANTPEHREREVFGDPLQTLWKNCIFGLCGVTDFHRRTFGVVVTSTAEERRIWLDEVETTLGRVFPPSE